MTHINPGTDTTINPVVIDDSKRERKQQPKPSDQYIISEWQLSELIGFQLFKNPELARAIRSNKYEHPHTSAPAPGDE